MVTTQSDQNSMDELARKLVGRHQGIIRELQIVEPRSGDWPYYYGGASLCDAGYLAGCAGFRPPAGGIGLTREQAFYSIVGESLERYCAAFRRAGNIVYATADKISTSAPAVTPAALSCFSAQQYEQPGFPFRQWQQKDELDWLVATDLYVNETRYVPAAWAYMHNSPEYSAWIPANSTGLACGSTLEAAIENAIYEVLERDAYALCWLFADSVTKIIPDQKLLEQIPCWHHPDWSVEFYNLTGKEKVPVVLAVLKAPRSCANGPVEDVFWYSHGVAAHLDPVTAAVKAYREAMLACYFLESRWQSIMLETDEKTVREPDSFDAHALYYNRHPDKLKYLELLLSSRQCEWADCFGSDPFILPEAVGALGNDVTTERVSMLKNRLLQNGVTGAWVDLTTPDAGELGFHVVRVLLHGFTWLHGDNRLPFLGTQRAQNPGLFYTGIESVAGPVRRKNFLPHALG